MRAALLLLAICVAFFWKLVLSNQYTYLDSPDAAYQILPWLQFQAGEWHQGPMPLWDPYLWGGQPLLGQMCFPCWRRLATPPWQSSSFTLACAY